ncbi:hypothetical protein SAMN05414139_09276 [Burkholderia sp. D7]|nr:hypothetical protein SAMN05414139_09276 [Burkholderia sp. D7]
MRVEHTVKRRIAGGLNGFAAGAFERPTQSTGASATVRSGGQQSDAMVFNHSSPTSVINAQRIGELIEHFEPPVDARTARTRGR